MVVVERHYLKTYGGGFTENFYGLKRERVLQIKGGEAPRARLGAPSLMRETLRLRERDIWHNLAIMVGLPYLKRKLDESYDIHAPHAAILGPSYNRDNLPNDANIRQRILYHYKWFLRNIYPSVNAAYYFSLLVFNLAYLFDNSKYSSPFLWLIGIRLRRLSEADHRAIALATQPAPTSPSHAAARPGQASSIFNPLIFASTIYPRLLSSLRLLLPTSIFALKFLEWWHASDFARQLSKKATEGLDLPPPVISGLPPKSFSKSTSGLTPASGSLSPTPAPANTVSLSSPPSENHQRTPPPTAFHTPAKHSPPICATTLLPIHTVPAPKPNTSSLCPICLHPIQTPTSAQTGFVFCYTCIFKWLDGSHERQIAFMEGRRGTEEDWDEEHDGEGRADEGKDKEHVGSREGKWESGKGRCAVTGRMVLAGTDGLRRVMV
ncbi:ubiquitin-protein ligase peroxin 12 [Imshaugia aleurites]|uniref:Peroxisome assembly protein 12 n=1 Tax=Imshaugia aleurites TaxID=172621 RepID=A0A8H3EWE9_9LECA|nr:ubiquitin-protein ligase peroxin 12 [Imshaugia aleurites]